MAALAAIRATSAILDVSSGCVAPQQQRGDGGAQQQQATASGVARHPAGKSWHARKLAADRPIPHTNTSMFDKEYFATTLARDVEVAGGHPIVDIQLTSGHSHRIRNLVDVASGYVTVSAYLGKGDLAHHRPRYGDTPAASPETFFAVISYESIAAVVIDPSKEQDRVRPGFAAG